MLNPPSIPLLNVLSGDNKILLSKLHTYGIRDCILQWFQSYLGNRKLLCKINQKLSSTKEVHCDAPQGSNMERCFFLFK